jgi:hypothetical protein
LVSGQTSFDKEREEEGKKGGGKAKGQIKDRLERVILRKTKRTSI